MWAECNSCYADDPKLSVCDICLYVKMSIICKFLHALENDQVLLAHPPLGTGAHLTTFFKRGSKIGLKCSDRKKNKKFELMLTRRAEAYIAIPFRKLSVCLQPFRRSSFLYFVLQQKIAKINNKQHVCFYLQSFSRYTR